MLVNPGDPENNFTADADTGYWGFLSYGINEDLVGAEIGGKKAAVGRYAMGLWATGEESQWAGERLQGNLDRIYDPGTVLLLVDSGPDSWKEYVESYGSTSSPLDGYVNLIISAKCDGPWLSNSQKRWAARVPVKRHPGGRVNVTFADFHAQTVKPVTWDVTVSLGKEFPYPKEHSAKVRVSPYKPFPD